MKPLLTALLIPFAWLPVARAADAPAGPPDVIALSTDDLGYGAKPEHAKTPHAPPSMVAMDFKRYLAPLNVKIDGPSQGIRASLPLGNGRMGALVVVGGKSQSKVFFDLGRSDVTYSGTGCKVSDKSPYNHKGVVAKVELDFGDPVFAACTQELNVHDGIATVAGEGVSLRLATWRHGDVLAVEITDDRPVPADITLRLHMPVAGISRNGYSAKVAFSPEAGVPGLDQTFSQEPLPGGKEPVFHCASSCKVGVPGRTLESTAKGHTQTTRIPAAKGKTVVYFASAASMDPEAPVDQAAAKALASATAAGYAAIEKTTVADWHAFWRKSFILLPQTHDLPFSQSVDQHWAFYLYCMNICGSGRFPANPDGAMFRTGVWGQPYWWFNGSRQALLPAFEMAGHPELADPWFRMLHDARPRFEKAAEQVWGCAPGSVWIPEVFTANGPEILPANIADPLRRTLGDREKPSKELWAFASARNTSQSWWSFTRKGGKPHHIYGAHTHLLYNTGEAAQWFWDRYAYTGDKEWLKTAVYPMLKGVAQLYMTHPKTVKGADGFHHLHNLGWAETILGGMQDGLNDLAALRGILPLAIETSKELDLDADLRAKWQDFLDHLAPYPTNASPRPVIPLTRPGEPATYSLGIGPVNHQHPGGGSIHDPRLNQVNIYDLVNLEARETQTLGDAEWNTAMNTLERQPMVRQLNAGGIAGWKGLTGLPSRVCEEAARMGRADLVEKYLATGFPKVWQGTDQSLPNHINMVVDTAPDWQWEGPLALGLSQAMLQSLSAKPGAAPVIRVFPAWPKARDCAFSLRAKGDFMVTSAMKQGRIAFVEIQPARGGTCRIRNPWGEAQEVRVWRNGVEKEALSGALLTLETAAGEDLVLMRAGETPERAKLRLPENRTDR